MLLWRQTVPFCVCSLPFYVFCYLCQFDGAQISAVEQYNDGRASVRSYQEIASLYMIYTECMKRNKCIFNCIAQILAENPVVNGD